MSVAQKVCSTTMPRSFLNRKLPLSKLSNPTKMVSLNVRCPKPESLGVSTSPLVARATQISLPSSARMAKKIAQLMSTMQTDRYKFMAQTLEPSEEKQFGRNLGTSLPQHFHVFHQTFSKNNRRLQLCADICYINNIPFLITITRHLKLRTVDDVKDTKDKTVLSSLRDVIEIYTSRGFEIEYVHADNGFRGLSNDLLPTRLNLAAAGEHVPEVERSIRTLKERTRAAIHGLPFKRHPTQLIIANVRHHNSWLNRFSAKDGVSSTLSQRQIVWGDSPDFALHCRLEFGSYCEIFQPLQTTNTTAARTVGGLALYSANNLQGGF